jgi:glycosyltransferase involved in cell wall biosynthesis
MDKNKISVLMPVKNSEAFLEEAIISILSQSYREFELILTDNGSSDRSWQIMMDHKSSDNRIKVLRNRNIGFTSSLNLMLDIASGEFIARLDSDDIADISRLERQREALINDNLAIMATGKCIVVDADGNRLYESGPSEDKIELKRSLIFKNEIWHSSVMWKNRKEIRYNNSFAYAQDYDLWSRMCRKHDIICVSGVVGAVRKRKGSITEQKRIEQDAFALAVSKSNMEHCLGRVLSDQDAMILRQAREGIEVSQEQMRTYQELLDKFESSVKKNSSFTNAPIRIKIGKKQKTEEEDRLNRESMDEIIKISKRRWRESTKKVEDGKKYIWLERESRYAEVEICSYEISPAYGASTEKSPWEGFCEKKPWQYDVTAVIPCLNTPETLPICVELLRLQTKRPFIVIIDTGSTERNLKYTEEMRSEDVEVHSIRLNGVRHPSDYPAMAMDMAFSLCRTEYLFATHSDCFLRRREVVQEFVDLCKTKSPVVGYELSPRAHEDWVGMVSHTASMYHMPTMDKIGFGWSLRRLCNRYGIVDYKPDPNKPNWPDTEILGNYILRDNSITPHLVGSEGNQCRTLDDHIDHFRSYGAAKMYSPQYYPKVFEWYNFAKKEALERIEAWSIKR